MNTDIRMQITFPHHPKKMKLQRRLGKEGVLSLIFLWCFAGCYHTDGKLDNLTTEDIAIAGQWDGDPDEFVNVLTEIGFLEVVDGCYCLHDWTEHNGWAAHSKERSEHARKAAESKWDKRFGKSGSAQNKKEQCPKPKRGNAPSPTPTPIPSPNPEPKPEENNIYIPEKTNEKPEKEIKKNANQKLVTDCYQENYIRVFKEKPFWNSKDGSHCQHLFKTYPDVLLVQAINHMFAHEDLWTVNLGNFMSLTSDSFLRRAISQIRNPNAGKGTPKRDISDPKTYPPSGLVDLSKIK